MKDNILSLPDEVIGAVFKEIYREMEHNVRNMFDDVSNDVYVRPSRVMEILHKRGLDEYGSQLYIFGAMLTDGLNDRRNPCLEINQWEDVYRLADKLNVSINSINPQNAFEYYNNITNRR